MKSTMEQPRTIEVNGAPVSVRYPRFSNGRFSINLVSQDGSPYMRCVANIPEVELEDDEVIIRGYECEGIMGALQEAHIIGPIVKFVVGGHVAMPVCKLLEAPGGPHE